jgi:hypothetical protein
VQQAIDTSGFLSLAWHLDGQPLIPARLFCCTHPAIAVWASTRQVSAFARWDRSSRRGTFQGNALRRVAYKARRASGARCILHLPPTRIADSSGAPGRAVAFISTSSGWDPLARDRGKRPPDSMRVPADARNRCSVASRYGAAAVPNASVGRVASIDAGAGGEQLGSQNCHRTSLRSDQPVTGQRHQRAIYRYSRYSHSLAEALLGVG